MGSATANTSTERAERMTPADRDLNDRLLTALERNPYLSRRNLRFENECGRVTLHGVVRSYYQKQMAQEVLRGIDGVSLVDNRLEVAWS